MLYRPRKVVPFIDRRWLLEVCLDRAQSRRVLFYVLVAGPRGSDTIAHCFYQQVLQFVGQPVLHHDKSDGFCVKRGS
jgi:hypothetical protein